MYLLNKSSLVSTFLELCFVCLFVCIFCLLVVVVVVVVVFLFCFFLFCFVLFCFVFFWIKISEKKTLAHRQVYIMYCGTLDSNKIFYLFICSVCFVQSYSCWTSYCTCYRKKEPQAFAEECSWNTIHGPSKLVRVRWRGRRNQQLDRA